jgi:uncharacterized protein YkwD
VCCALSSVAVADVDKGVNAIRQRGCENQAGVREALRRSRGLDEVARQWSKGGRLHDAIAKTDYRVASSSSMRIEGAKNERALCRSSKATTARRCWILTSRRSACTSTAASPGSSVATPQTLPKADDMSQVAARVLELVNEARAKPRKCGSRAFPPVPPLKLSPLLSRAALEHAKDMSANKLFEHRGSDGSMPRTVWLALGTTGWRSARTSPRVPPTRRS